MYQPNMGRHVHIALGVHRQLMSCHIADPGSKPGQCLPCRSSFLDLSQYATSWKLQARQPCCHCGPPRDKKAPEAKYRLSKCSRFYTFYTSCEAGLGEAQLAVQLAPQIALWIAPAVIPVERMLYKQEMQCYVHRQNTRTRQTT
jgi:hypothetical protein